MNRRQFLAGVAGAGLLSACGATQRPTSIEQIDVVMLNQRLQSQPDLLLLDVRTAQEYTSDGHIAGSKLIPVQQLEQRLADVPRDRPLACICHSGNRSATACDILARNGYTQIANVRGGMTAWNQAGFAIEH